MGRSSRWSGPTARGRRRRWRRSRGCCGRAPAASPSMGLAPQLVREIFRIIADLKAEGNTILLVEQNARKALSICDYAYVMESGRITLEGTGDELLHNDAMVSAYLGGTVGTEPPST